MIGTARETRVHRVVKNLKDAGVQRDRAYVVVVEHTDHEFNDELLQTAITRVYDDG